MSIWSYMYEFYNKNNTLIVLLVTVYLSDFCCCLFLILLLCSLAFLWPPLWCCSRSHIVEYHFQHFIRKYQKKTTKDLNIQAALYRKPVEFLTHDWRKSWLESWVSRLYYVVCCLILYLLRVISRPLHQHRSLNWSSLMLHLTYSSQSIRISCLR